MLRTRSGDFIRDMIRENAGVEGESQALEDWPNADCNVDACLVTVRKDERDWQIMATRSSHYIPVLALSAACRRADIVVSERWLPASSQPRWLKVDRNLLSQVGGITINLDNQNIATARETGPAIINGPAIALLHPATTTAATATRFQLSGSIDPPHRDDRNAVSGLESEQASHACPPSRPVEPGFPVERRR
jgi:hypothetical protein